MPRAVVLAMVSRMTAAAILALFPHLLYRPCIEARRARIVAVAEASAPTVPPAVLLSVALHESHFGCAPGSGGCWGAPVDPVHRHDAGTPAQAARALATGYRVCGTWAGAVGRFRSGLCAPTSAVHRRYVATVMALAARVGGP